MTTIKTQLDKNDYANVCLVMLFRKTFMKIYIGIAVVLLAAAIIESIYLPQNTSLFQWLFPFAMAVWLPVTTYVTAITSFKKQPRLSESIQYTFHPQTLEVVGQSFDGRLSWDKIYNVVRTKNWLLIYQTKHSANIIPIKDTTELDLAYLKEILAEQGVKNNL